MKSPNAFAAPYGSTGAYGVRSVCGTSVGRPNTHADDAVNKRVEKGAERMPSSKRVRASAPSSTVPAGSFQASGPNETAAKL